MSHDEPVGCIHPTQSGEECAICADREDARIFALSAAALRAECRAEGMDPGGIVADMDAVTKKAIFSVLHTRDMLDELIRRLNYDGHDLNSITIAELRRAI